ncbi:hypothetical protein ABG067_008093, partial [Albugo candida]
MHPTNNNNTNSSAKSNEFTQDADSNGYLSPLADSQEFGNTLEFMENLLPAHLFTGTSSRNTGSSGNTATGSSSESTFDAGLSFNDGA